jgi:hypothetical protein
MRTFVFGLVTALSGCSNKSSETSLFEKAVAAKLAGSMDTFCAEHASLSEDEMVARISADLEKRAESGGPGVDRGIEDGESASEDYKATYDKVGRQIWLACHPEAAK